MLLLVLKEQPEKEKEKESRPGVSLLSYRPFFRELDMEVLSVLQCGLLSCSLLDSECQTKARTICFLMKDNKAFVIIFCMTSLFFGGENSTAFNHGSEKYSLIFLNNLATRGGSAGSC